MFVSGGQQRNSVIHIHVLIMVSRWVKREEGIVREFEIDMHTLLYLKWITGEDLLYSTGNSV